MYAGGARRADSECRPDCVCMARFCSMPRKHVQINESDISPERLWIEPRLLFHRCHEEPVIEQITRAMICTYGKRDKEIYSVQARDGTADVFLPSRSPIQSLRQFCHITSEALSIEKHYYKALIHSLLLLSTYLLLLHLLCHTQGYHQIVLLDPRSNSGTHHTSPAFAQP